MSDWTDQTLDLWQTYADAQGKLWQDWLDAAGQLGATANGPTSGSSTDTSAGGGPAAFWETVWNEWPARWQDMARKTLNVWTTGTQGVPREVVDRLFQGEEAYLQFLDLSLGALKVVAPRVDAGEDWVELLQRYLAEIRDSMIEGPSLLTPESVGAVASGMPDLWRLYMTELQRFIGPWADAAQTAWLGSSDLAAGDRQSFARAQAAFMDAFDGTFGRYAAAPTVGYSRELNERLFRGFAAWGEVRRAALEFQTEMVNIGFHSYERMLRDLVEKGERGEQITSFRELYELWIDVGERGYAEVFSTDGFAELQARLVNASMQYQMRVREIEEEFLAAMGQPTRTEVDQVHRHIYDVRIEVRYMKREMAGMRRQIESLTAELEEERQKARVAGEEADTAAQSAQAAVESEPKPAARSRSKSSAGSTSKTTRAKTARSKTTRAKTAKAEPGATGEGR